MVPQRRIFTSRTSKALRTAYPLRTLRFLWFPTDYDLPITFLKKLYLIGWLTISFPMMNATLSSSILTIALRVQAHRAPLVSDREWEVAIAMANIEVYKHVMAVLDTFFGMTSDVQVNTTTTLTQKCEPKLCADIKADITIVPSLEQLENQLVVGALRQAVYDKKREYMDLGFSVAWLAPNITATLIGWHIDGLLSTASSKEELFFCSEAKKFLSNSIRDADHTCDAVVILNQFMKGISRLEVHSALLGTSANDNARPYRKKALEVFNNITSNGFLDQFRSSPPLFASMNALQAFALHGKDIVASRMPPTLSPTYNRDSPPYNRLPYTINTKHLGIALGVLAVVIQICAAVVIVVIRKSRMQRLSKTEQDDSLSVICSDDDGGSKNSL